MDYPPPSQAKIESALYAVSPEDRTVWFKMGAAIKSELGENGREMWEAWSQQSQAYNAQSAQAAWKSMKPGKIEIASLFRAAQENGWQSPKETPTPTLSPEERRQRKEARETEALNLANEERVKQANAAKTAQQQIAQAGPASEDHPYLIDKHVGPHGIQQAGDKLLIPLRNAEGEITSLQRIDEEGKKRLLSNGVKQGSYHVLGKIEPGKPVGIAEGYATAATLHENLNIPVVVAVDSNNLRPVAIALKQQHPTAALQIFADDDLFIEREGIRTGKPKANAGIKSAIEAARATGANIVVPTFRDADVSKDSTDFNDVQRRYGAGSVEDQYHSRNRRTADQVQAWHEARKANYRTQVAEASAQQEAAPVTVSKKSVGVGDLSAEVKKAEQLIDQSLAAKSEDKVQQYRNEATQVAESLATKTANNPFSAQDDARLHRSFENATERPPVRPVPDVTLASLTALDGTLNDRYPKYSFNLQPAVSPSPKQPGVSPPQKPVINEIVNTGRAVTPVVDAPAMAGSSPQKQADSPPSVKPDIEVDEKKTPSFFQRAGTAIKQFVLPAKGLSSTELPPATTKDPAASEPSVPAQRSPNAIPAHLNKRYVIEGDMDKARYYFLNNTEEEAFRHKGDRLTTTHSSEAIVKSMMVVAEAKGFTEIAVRGTKDFKRAAWMEASVRGIQVSGYEPTEQDRQQLDKRMNTLERASERSPEVPATTAVSAQKTTPGVSAVKTAPSAEADKPQAAAAAKVADPALLSTLSSAVKTLDRETAIERYPALKPVYTLVKSAADFAANAPISANDKDSFAKVVEYKALAMIANGQKVPAVIPPTPSTPTADAELSR